MTNAEIAFMTKRCKSRVLALLLMYAVSGLATSSISQADLDDLNKNKQIYELAVHFAHASAEGKTAFTDDPYINTLERQGWGIRMYQYDDDKNKQQLAAINLCPESLLKNQYYVLIHGRGSLVINNKHTNIDIVAFRGSKVKQNWIFSDFQLQSTPFFQPIINPEDIDDSMKVHCGFNEYIYAASQNPSNVLEQFFQDVRANINNKNKLFIIAGHSLGGAAANIFASAVYGGNEEMKAINNLYLITFGQPAVGKKPYKSYYKKAIKHYVRFINQGDIVPLMTSLVGYKHFGKQIICKSREYCKRTKISKFLPFTKRECDSEGGLHSIKEYQSIVDGLTQDGRNYADTHHCVMSNDDNYYFNSINTDKSMQPTLKRLEKSMQPNTS